jgi:hypothetical protein
MLEQVQSSLSGSAARPRFAAASVRPAKLSELLSPVKCLGADGLLWGAPSVQDRRGRCTAQVTDLRVTLHDAYASSGMVSWDRVVGFPRRSFSRIEASRTTRNA